MNKKECIIIKSNPLSRDIRVPKEIDALKGKFHLTFLGWNRDGNPKNDCQKKGFKEILLDFHSPYGTSKIIMYIPLWWIYIFYWLMLHDWDIVHVINFDSVLPVIIAGKIKRKKVIYEILDTFEDSFKLNSFIRNMIINFDKILIYLADAIILADSSQIEEFNGIPNKNIVILYDSPPDLLSIKSSNSSLKKNFIIFYAGVLYKNRKLNLENIIAAIEDIDGVELIIAGYGDLVNTIRGYENRMPNKLHFIGQLSYEDTIKHYLCHDLLFVLRDPIVPINKYICGSTLLNAFMCGKPIIVNSGTSTAKKVIEEKCGIVVDASNISAIRDAILMLKDNLQLYKEMSANSRNAYERRYDWRIMEVRLQNLYDQLVN